MSDKAIITKFKSFYNIQIVTDICGIKHRNFYSVDELEIENSIVNKLNKKMREDRKNGNR